MHFDYVGNEDVVVGNNIGFIITHIGSSIITSPTTSFKLNDVLCAPLIKTNFISVSQFCKQNNASIKFFSTCFLVKDLSTGHSWLEAGVDTTCTSGLHLKLLLNRPL